MRRALRFTFIVLLAAVLLISIAAYLGFGRSLRCIFPSRGPVRNGISARVVVSHAVRRCYLLYVPPGFDPETPVPVLFAMHGLAGNPQGFRRMTGWEEIADRETFLVVYPHGSAFPLRWNTSPAFRIESTDDVQFVVEMLDDLSDLASLDADRVYLTGFSNGAGMADLIACRLAGRIAAVGLVEGKNENAPGSCAPSRPVPVIGFFGTADPLETAEFPPWFYGLLNLSSDPQYREGVALGVWEQAWARRNGCDLSPRELPAVGEASAKGYRDCAEDADVVVYRIEGGGHTWPGGSNFLPFLGEVSDLDASEIMWEFFEGHPRVRASQED